MNQVHLIGRFVKDVQIAYSPTHIAYINFTLAVPRAYKNQQGERQADFIPCRAFRQTAELIGQYGQKGKQIAVDGHIQTELYQGKDGKTKQSIQLIVNRLYFIERVQESKKTTFEHHQEESFVFFPEEPFDSIEIPEPY